MSDGIGFLGQDELQRFDELLEGYLRQTRIRCALLVDRAGRLITAVGERGGLDDIAVASLAAADFAASDQLAVLLGEREFSSLYHHGDPRSMYLADVHGRAILASLFDHRTTLGMVRITTKTIVPELGTILDEIARRSPGSEAIHMDAAWVEEVEDEIDRLFSE
jgi:predicted regulator of Ras-like GTPase activity (Roadblock/LC7/MglB family)